MCAFELRLLKSLRHRVLSDTQQLLIYMFLCAIHLHNLNITQHPEKTESGSDH